MFIVGSYGFAVALCIITMICWGSWANTQKLASKSWPFQLYYWDYVIGLVLLTFVCCITFGSFGSEGRHFFTDLGQASQASLISAFIGGVIFNLSNILLVIAIDIAGMAVAFPIGIGIALVLGVIVNYIKVPIGDPYTLFIGVAFIVVAILLDAWSYKRIGAAHTESKVVKGIIVAIIAGLLMGLFYRFVAASMSLDFAMPKAGQMTPYSATFVFSIGILASNFVWNTIVMKWPLNGPKAKYSEYFKGSFKLHCIGILGGVIWAIGTLLSFLASGKAGYAISYGLGQGATLVAALWGVFIWKEFKAASRGTVIMLSLMFVCFFIGLILIIASN